MAGAGSGGPVGQSPNRIVIRLRTAAWHDQKGLHMRRDMLFLRRRCAGFNWLEEEADVAGADDPIRRIINLHQCQDGIYQVLPCHEHRDFETGHIEHWDYRLVPFEEE
ncbi:hypothetical protein CKO41_14145 [Thiococcus pfennigii]|nr:hypothetical protein [Thiococcus pfennigii]